MFLLIFGAVLLVIGFGIITGISYDDERTEAAVAFILGILGAFFICASGG